MGELDGEIELPEYRPPRRQLELAMPLIQYLDRLENSAQDRALTRSEDEQAIRILLSLVPKDNAAAKACTAEYTQPRYRQTRTLASWYMMSKHLVDHLGYYSCCRYDHLE